MISTVRAAPAPGTSTIEGTTTGEQEGLPLVGRSELLDRAVNLVLVGGNVLLFGADGCGRTAILHEVVHRLATEERGTVLIDGSGVDEPRRLVALIVRACGLTVPADLDVPSMLGCLPAPAAAQRVIAIDDLEVSAGQELFGRWHRHLWRLGAQWVAVGGGDDPTPYLDAGADEWWEDGILPVPVLGAAEARELVIRRLQTAGVDCPCPDQLIAAARGNPRDLVRRVRSFLLREMASRTRGQRPVGWAGGGAEEPMALWLMSCQPTRPGWSPFSGPAARSAWPTGR